MSESETAMTEREAFDGAMDRYLKVYTWTEVGRDAAWQWFLEHRPVEQPIVFPARLEPTQMPGYWPTGG
jgi:hypothetical protein